MAGRALAMSRYEMLASHLHEGVPLARLAAAQGEDGPCYRTLPRWLAGYRRSGLDGLARASRSDKGLRRFPDELVAFIEGLALRKPRPSAATIHRQAESVAKARGWPVPGYWTVHGIVADLDPALATLGVDGTKKYRESFELVYRREATKPNEIWQADHTELDIWVLDERGKPARPWLTAIEDDHSHAIAGYAVNPEAPSALTTALAFRHAIWRKPEPDWHVCGIPSVFHLDHGSDFTSAHLEQVMADLRVQPVFSLKGQPHGHGKIERLIGTINQMCLAHLPGYAPRGTPDRASQAKLTLAELDAAVGRFIREVYNLRTHSRRQIVPTRARGVVLLFGLVTNPSHTARKTCTPPSSSPITIVAPSGLATSARAGTVRLMWPTSAPVSRQVRSVVPDSRSTRSVPGSGQTSVPGTTVRNGRSRSAPGASSASAHSASLHCRTIAMPSPNPV